MMATANVPSRGKGRQRCSKDNSSSKDEKMAAQFDEQGLDSGDMIVVESRAYPWFGLLGNSTGLGRPQFIESEVPLKCMVDSLARPCVESGVGNTRETYAPLSAGATGAGTYYKRRYSHGSSNSLRQSAAPMRSSRRLRIWAGPSTAW